jgi:3-phosphoshikimate 1-carboxyvinyltransferase
MNAERLTIHPGALSGEVVAPPSKSMMQRACAAAWIRGGQTRITNPGNSNDDEVVIALMRAAGCIINTDDSGRLVIDAVKPEAHTLPAAHFGESGLAARMCTPILALAGHKVQLLGNESLSQRPMQFFAEVLPTLDVTAVMENGRLPASISGQLKPKNIEVDGSLSSQFITGLLLAYAGAGAKDVSITVNNAVSKPYLDLTLDVMQQAGLKTPRLKGEATYYFDASEPKPVHATLDLSIAGDWSGAAFMLVAGAIAGRVTVTGLDAFSTQGDKAILTALMDAGVRLSIEASQVTAAPAQLQAFQAGATNTPDLFPPLAALACYAQGTSVIEGVGRLRGKESDRAACIISELGKMGADITLQDDLMIVRGGKPLHGAEVSSHNDHRIAMMCAIAALGAEGSTTIADAAAVNKSYPDFFEHLHSLGVRIEPAG